MFSKKNTLVNYFDFLIPHKLSFLLLLSSLQHIAPYGISAGQKMDHHGHHLKGWASELSCLGGLDAFKVVMIASISHSKARQGSRGM
eukprot:scaffold261019_cov15-Tisochrysis_lutea.AAC.1